MEHVNRPTYDGPNFVGYLVAGYPDRNNSLRIIRDCCEAGLDILELGFPARDASMDGATIRQAQERVDKTLAKDLNYWRAVREAVSVPIWLMGYAQDLSDQDICIRLGQENLYDALVIPDADQSQRARMRKLLEPKGIEVVEFINANMSHSEVDMALSSSRLIYQQLYCGVTGVAHSDDSYLPLMRYARANSQAKLFAGFGISTRERVQELLGNGFDGAIIGSAIVNQLLHGEKDAIAFIRSLNEAAHSAPVVYGSEKQE